ncbi:hypothetical protein TNCV_4542781 [Trichonephila clavipes]|uniref:Uncharacterized protein n=2 Tax=Trichonephila TaxID=2585208 RepID=A0A8X6JAF2_TRICU|nr:hypothetical protein TNCT_35991 [Trichonephila clavata]GFW93751.1 hypothetical protein TNCV_4542781 [Trichonephila clavipes]GFY72142.1 hypothetical protein TNIN_258891 [Trichonephila inaurata madagascariensis]
MPRIIFTTQRAQQNPNRQKSGHTRKEAAPMLSRLVKLARPGEKYTAQRCTVAPLRPAHWSVSGRSKKAKRLIERRGEGKGPARFPFPALLRALSAHCSENSRFI